MRPYIHISCIHTYTCSNMLYIYVIMSWLFLDDECSCFSFLNDILLTATKVQRITAVMSEVTWRRKKKLRPYIRCN